jgi:hypothetical protein
MEAKFFLNILLPLTPFTALRAGLILSPAFAEAATCRQARWGEEKAKDEVL